jgi:acyl-[acyl-carrier-protein]-phospholipid O-acyltransferase/long-chain-fatty-acid--[acyl-carrier-protein] ligase
MAVARKTTSEGAVLSDYLTRLPWPVAALRWLVRELVRWLFRVRVRGLEHYHAAGNRVLIIANHASLLDGFLLYLFLPEPPTFAINTLIAQRKLFQPLLAFVRLFPVDPLKPLSMKGLVHYLSADRKAVIFPEGRMSTTGTLMKIYEGPGMVADKAQASLLPIGIEGSQYSSTSNLRGKLRLVWLPRITITILPPRRLALPEHLDASSRRLVATDQLRELMRELYYENFLSRGTLFQAVLEAMDRHGADFRIAEDMDRQPVSYRQLLTRSFILGRLLAQQTEPAQRIGVLLPNSVGSLTVMLAVQACGRVACVLNFTAGPQALILACQTAQIARVYTSHRFVEKAELQPTIEALTQVTELVYLEDLKGQIGLPQKLLGLLAGRFPASSYRRLAGRLASRDTAVILFTSGTESAAKGVALSHRNILANVAQVRVEIDLSQQDCLFNAMPIFHAFGLTAGVWLPLLAGCPLFMYPTPLHYRIIPELCYELNATVMFGTNTFLAGYAASADPRDFARMRYVVCGAEKLQDDTRQRWADKFGVRVFEGYGATEASPVLAANSPNGNQPGTVGRLFPRIAAYLQPVEGIEGGGRLVVRGPNIMQGYILPGGDGAIQPPATERGAGWYDTGDVVSIGNDGFVRILGRVKRFAKIGGEMISLAGVEDLATQAWPNDQHAAVAIGHESKGEQIILVTSFVSANRADLLTAARSLGLSEINVPRRFVCTPCIPLLATGKVDYRALNDLVRREFELD